MNCWIKPIRAMALLSWILCLNKRETNRHKEKSRSHSPSEVNTPSCTLKHRNTHDRNLFEHLKLRHMHGVRGFFFQGSVSAEANRGLTVLTPCKPSSTPSVSSLWRAALAPSSQISPLAPSWRLCRLSFGVWLHLLRESLLSSASRDDVGTSHLGFNKCSTECT